MPSTLELLRANFSRRAEIQGELRSIDEAATTDQREYSEEEAARIPELRSELEAIDGRMVASLEIETRSQEIDNGLGHLLGTMVDRQSGEMLDTRSIGERFTQADGYAEWAQSPHGSFAVDLDGLDVRAVTDATTGAASAGAFIVPTMLPRIAQSFLDRRVYLTDLLPRIPVSTGSVEYVQDISPLADMANKAVETTEGSAKPQAGITTQLNVEPIATVPAWVNITRQAAADVPQMQGYLDTRLRYSLKRRFDIQTIAGDGSLPNIKGLKNRSGIVTYAPGSAEARAISIRHSITLMEAAESVPEIIVLNPADAELFDLTNFAVAGVHATPDSEGGAQQAPSRTAWGLTQVHSNAMASGTALLIDPMATAILDRMQPTAYMTDSHASNFTANILTLLLELRAGLALFEPSGICLTTFNGTT
jgi:HK97 family phage major capsid protein